MLPKISYMNTSNTAWENTIQKVNYNKWKCLRLSSNLQRA